MKIDKDGKVTYWIVGGKSGEGPGTKEKMQKMLEEKRVEKKKQEKAEAARKEKLKEEVESNIYVYSKYLAEKHIIHSMESEGLRAKIMRVGNLMGIDRDGEFQINFKTNNFLNTLRAYSVLGCFPYSGLDEREEFSPIDETASAIVKLSGTGDDFNDFHVYNSNSIEMGEFMSIMKKCGINIDFVEDEAFEEKNLGFFDVSA